MINLMDIRYRLIGIAILDVNKLIMIVMRWLNWIEVDSGCTDWKFMFYLKYWGYMYMRKETAHKLGLEDSKKLRKGRKC